MMVKAKQKKKSNQLPLTQCKGCPKKFYPKDLRQHYHNEECREAYYAKTIHKRETVVKTCPNCGTSFPTTMPKKRKFCCDDCRDENREKQIDRLQNAVNENLSRFYGDRFKTLQAVEFKCSYCGKGVSDNIKLDVEPVDSGGYRTICSECVVGKNYQE